MNFARGQKSKLADLTPATELTVGLDVQAPGSPVFDTSCFGLDAEGRLSDDRYFVFYNQTQSPEGEIRLLGANGGDSGAFGVDLARLPREIQRLVFAITLDDTGTMSQVTRGHVRLSASGSEVARFPFSGSDFGGERTIVAGELYREGVWRFAAVGQGFDGGLSALLEHFGGEEVEEEPSEFAAAQPVEAGDAGGGSRGRVASGTKRQAGGLGTPAIDPNAQAPPTQIRDDHPSLDGPAKEDSTGRNIPKWELAARDRLRAAIERYSQPLADLFDRDANEGDTRLLVTDLLCDGFGFNKYEDLTTEYRIRGRYVDYGLRIDRDLVALMEVKRIAMRLAARHLLQARSYALDKGVEWVLLTNGARWKAYRVTASMPVEVFLVLDVDLLGPGTPAEKAEELFYLTRESLKRRQMDELWKARRATAPGSLAEVLVSGPVLAAVRKELRRRTGHKTEEQEIARLLRETVIRDGCLD